MTEIDENVQAVLERIGRAALRAGRDPSGVTLVAVSKTFPVDMILAVHAQGVRHFGENRVEEAAQKIPEASGRIGSSSPIIWHMVGHLQSRKVRAAVPLFDWVESVDSIALARRLDTQVAALSKTLPVLLEVNVSGETSKYGIPAEPRAGVYTAVREIAGRAHLDLQGLMTVAPIVSDPEQARRHFRALRQLRDELLIHFPERALPHLSMGMTDDFEVAIDEGATIVRIGRAIFGERPCAV